MHGTITTVVSIFILLLIGYGAKRIGILKAGDEAVVNSILINITLPAFIFINTIGQPLSSDMIKVPVLGLAVEAIIILLAYVIGRLLRLDRRTLGALMIVAAFGNTGYLGYPVAKAAFPGDGQGVLTAVIFDNFAMRIGLITVGVAIATSSAGERFEWSALTQLLKTPLLPAAVLGLVFRNCHIPKLIADTMEYLGAPTVALSMLSLGLTLSASSVRMYPAALISAVLLKMALFPLLMWMLLRAWNVTGTVADAAVISGAMPSAIFSGVVVSKFGANGRFAAAVVFVGTLLSIITIPLVLSVLR